MRAVMSVGVAIALGLGSATPAMAANQALMINGIGGGAGLPDVVMAEVLGGMFADYERHNVDWPQQARPVIGFRYTLAESVSIGADNLDAAIRRALTEIGPGEHVTVVGLSAGSLVADEELRRLAANPDIDPSLLNFVVVGDSSRMTLNGSRRDPFLNYTYTAPVDSPYDTTSVRAQYDGFADFPNQMNNLVAVANAIAGEMVSHVPSMFTDLSAVPADDISVTTNALGGVTRDYLIEPPHLPLVQVMPLLGLFGESGLKSVIDSAYLRNDARLAASEVNAVSDADAVAPATALPAASQAEVPAQPVADAADQPEPAGLEPTVDEPDLPGAGPRRGGPAGPGVKASAGHDDSSSPRIVRDHRGS